MMEHYVVKITGFKFQLKKASGMYRLVDDTRNLQVIIYRQAVLTKPNSQEKRRSA